MQTTPDLAPDQARLVRLAAAPRLTWLDGAMAVALLAEIGLHLVAARLAAGWWTAAATDAVLVVLLAGVAWWARGARPLVLRLLAFGLAAGIAELFTDFAGEGVSSLHYPTHEPMVWASPLYMPFSWMIVLAVLGYGAWRLAARVGLVRATVVAGLAGAAVIPFYEEMAYHAGWWRYASVRPLGHTPAYVLLFEGLVVATLPWLLGQVERRPFAQVLARGVLLGAWMPVAALLAWGVLGR
ncbi:MAG: hypothetical protein H0X24_20750 [Ktedonobacterales bacterium]|nr:hypothetical protein [Ktedonobacterales bacterium]